MAEWLITSNDNPAWTCRIGESSRDHAESVLASVQADAACPSDLFLHDLTPEPEPEPEPEAVPDPEPAPQKHGFWSIWRR